MYRQVRKHGPLQAPKRSKLEQLANRALEGNTNVVALLYFDECPCFFGRIILGIVARFPLALTQRSLF
jgi:hypothetical protein